MENAINSLRIQNFKSIKDVSIKPRRVNLLIGQPNVGKSNVLEAMSLLGAPLYEGSERFLGEVIRYETVSNLFYDTDVSSPIIVESSTGSSVLAMDELRPGYYKFVYASNNWKVLYEKNNNPLGFSFPDESIRFGRFDRLASLNFMSKEAETVSEILKVQKIPYSIAQTSIAENGINKDFFWNYQPNVVTKKYVFQSGKPHSKGSQLRFLSPPHGANLFNIVQKNPELRREMAVLFKPYGLSLVLRVGEQKFEIQKQVEDLIYNYPYSLIADTLQRIIFYLAAIESNKNSVLLFEEPEAHTFPVYTTMLGQKIVASETNQFFVATHSPYLLTEIVEEMVQQQKEQELGIFLAYYEDYQTKLYQLTDEEVREIRRDAIDVFYNLARYTPQANPYA